MKSRIAIALLVALAGTPGFAADLKLPAAASPPAAALPSWAGPYIGAHAGYLSGRDDLSFPGTDEFHFIDPKGFVGGVAAGYAWQWGQVVGGVEADVSFVDTKATIDTGFPPNPAITQLQTAITWNSHFRGRLGYSVNRAMFFVAGGLVVAGVDSNAFDNGAGAVASWGTTRSGWTIGGGIDYRIAPKASLRLEYLYDNYGTTTLAAQTVGATAFAARQSRLDTHTVRGGVSWHF